MFKKGFTLIELLVSIALLGVLAAVIIIMVNPVEAIARASDAKREQQINSVGENLYAYYTLNGFFPPPLQLLTSLVNSGDLKTLSENSGVITNCASVAGQGATLVNGYCYNASVISDEVKSSVLYSRLQSKTENSKCPSDQTAWYIWSAVAGRSGIVCTLNETSEPSLTTTTFADEGIANSDPSPTDIPTPTTVVSPTDIPTPTPTSQYIFNDEFNGNALDTTKWVAMNRNGDTSNSEIQCYLPSNVSVGGGIMTITSKQDAAGCAAIGQPFSYSSAMIQWPTFNFKYGRVDIRAKMPGGSGAWPALWFNGSNCQAANITWTADPNCNWPQPGSDEIDMAEFLNNNYTSVNQQIHSGANNGGCQPSISNASNNWHVYSMDWTPGQLQWLVDGVVTCPINSGVPSSNMFLMINTAIGGVGGGFVNPSTFPQTMQVDYVRVSAPASSPTPTPSPTAAPTPTLSPASQTKTATFAANDNSTGTIAWINPTFSLADDTQKATFTSSGTAISNYLIGGAFGFTIPANATIDGISVDIKKLRSGGTTGNIIDNKVYIIKNATFITTVNKATATSWPTTENYASYGSSADLWGQTWTPADINSDDFGIGISVKGNVSGNNRVANINNFRITVFYH